MFHTIVKRTTFNFKIPAPNLCKSIFLTESVSIRAASSSASSTNEKREKDTRVGAGVPSEELPYHHLMKRMSPTNFVKPQKFESPRKRANKMFATINKEAILKSQDKNPKVHDTNFRVGDAIELTRVTEGGVKSKDVDKIRGIVIGRKNRGLGSSVYLRDVLYGEAINRKIPLHSPLVKSLKVLQNNFLHKGKKKVRRAKLYYLRDRLPQETRVTKP